MRKPWWALCRPEAHYLLRLLRLVRRVFRTGCLEPTCTSPREVEIAPRSPTPRDTSAGRSHVYQRVEHAKGTSLAPGIVPKGQSRRAHGARRRTYRHQTLKADFGRLLARCHVAVSGEQSGPTGRSTPIHDAHAWAGAMGAAPAEGSMRGDARVSVANTPLRVW